MGKDEGRKKPYSRVLSSRQKKFKQTPEDIVKINMEWNKKMQLVLQKEKPDDTATNYTSILASTGPSSSDGQMNDKETGILKGKVSFENWSFPSTNSSTEPSGFRIGETVITKCNTGSVKSWSLPSASASTTPSVAQVGDDVLPRKSNGKILKRKIMEKIGFNVSKPAMEGGVLTSIKTMDSIDSMDCGHSKMILGNSMRTEISNPLIQCLNSTPMNSLVYTNPNLNSTSEYEEIEDGIQEAANYNTQPMRKNITLQDSNPNLNSTSEYEEIEDGIQEAAKYNTQPMRKNITLEVSNEIGEMEQDIPILEFPGEKEIRDEEPENSEQLHLKEEGEIKQEEYMEDRPVYMEMVNLARDGEEIVENKKGDEKNITKFEQLSIKEEGEIKEEEYMEDRPITVEFVDLVGNPTIEYFSPAAAIAGKTPKQNRISNLKGEIEKGKKNVKYREVELTKALLLIDVLRKEHSTVLKEKMKVETELAKKVKELDCLRERFDQTNNKEIEALQKIIDEKTKNMVEGIWV